MAQVTGKFVCLLPTVEGENSNGRWVRSGLVMETMDASPKYIALTVFGQERQRMLQGLNAGDIIIAEYSPESRNVGDKWFTDLKCLHIHRTMKM